MLVLHIFFSLFGAARDFFFFFLSMVTENQGKPWYMAYRYINSRNHFKNKNGRAEWMYAPSITKKKKSVRIKPKKTKVPMIF